MLLAGCGSGSVKHPAAPRSNVTSPTPGAGGGNARNETTQPTGESGAPTQATPPAVAATHSQTGSPASFPLAGTITPACVRPGGRATIVVQTLSKSAVAYDTYYSDGKTGGTPPFGDGLGGNASGLTDANGRYTSSWIVSPNAPPGAAYARVVVGHASDTIETRVPFAVSNPVGDC